MGLTLPPIEEAKSNTTVATTPASGEPLPLVILHVISSFACLGTADESDDKESHDRPNTPNEQG